MDHFLHEITPFVSQYGLWVVFFGMMVEGTMMILATGILVSLGMLPPGWAVVAALAGAVLGDHFWYGLGRRFGPWLFGRFPRLGEKVRGLEGAIRRRGAWFAFGERFVYSGAILFPVALGAYGYPRSRFTRYDLLGDALWSVAGIALGYALGTGAEVLLGRMEKVWHLLLLLGAVFLIVWLLRKKLPRRKAEDAAEPSTEKDG